MDTRVGVTPAIHEETTLIINRTLGVWKILRRHPQILSFAAQNLAHRFNHQVIKQFNQGWSAPPEHISVVLTDICNLRCKMCQYAFTDAPGYQLNQVGRMDPGLFHKLMDEVPGKPVVSFTGGETLLHPELANFVAYAKQQGRFCTVTSNGWMLEKRAQELCDAGLDLLVISVDGPHAIHDRVRGGQSFERLAAGLETILSKPRRPVVFVSMAISDLNYEHLIPMYELAQGWGVDGINFNHLWMQTHKMTEAYNARFSLFEADEVAWDIHPERVDADVVADSIAAIRRRARFSSLMVNQTPDLNRSDTRIWYSEPERFAKYTSTRCAWVRMKVWPDGSVKPCREWKAGNVATHHAMEVWNGEMFRSFRQTLAVHGTLPICARCCYMAYR